MTYDLLFLDIDGTILKSDHTYTESTKEAISRVKAKGVEVFLATGRPLHEVADLAKDLGIDSSISYNGAHAVYQNEVIVNEPMNQRTVEEFLEIAKNNGHEMVLYTNGKNYFTEVNDAQVKTFIETFQMKQNEPFTYDITDRVLGVTVMKLPPSQVTYYKLDTDIRLSQVNVDGIQHCYDVIRKTVNKGEAIKNVLHRLNIPKERAIAFGDGMNDKEMLQAVGESFAMENAHPDLFPYAKRRTTSVTDSGIFNGLRELGLLE